MRDARVEGIGWRRLTGSDLSAPFRGVRVHGPKPQGQTARCSAYLAKARPGDFFCDVSAAVIWGMPLSPRLESGDIDVGIRPPQHPPQANGVRGHRLSSSTLLSLHRGFPVTSPVDTWLRLAAVLSVDELVVAGDFIVSKHGLAVPLESLVRAVRRSSRRRGIRKLREAIVLIRHNVRSPKESEARLLIVRSGLPEPEVNGAISDDAGLHLLEGDLVYRDQRILLEYEGDGHRTDRRQWRRDIRRREIAEDHLWRTIRFTDDELGPTSGAFLSRLAEQLRLRSHRPS